MKQNQKERALWTIAKNAPFPEKETVSGYGNVTDTSMVIYCESGNKYLYNTRTRHLALANLRLVRSM